MHTQVLDNAFGYMARCLRRKKLEPAQACAPWVATDAKWDVLTYVYLD